MIAPIKETVDEVQSLATPAMRRARQLAAQLLPLSGRVDAAPRMAAWRAWSIAIWAAGVALTYLLAMFGRG